KNQALSIRLISSYGSKPDAGNCTCTVQPPPGVSVKLSLPLWRSTSPYSWCTNQRTDPAPPGGHPPVPAARQRSVPPRYQHVGTMGRRPPGHIGQPQTFFIKRWRALQPYSESTQRLACYPGLPVGHRGRPDLCAMWLDCHAGVATGAAGGSLLTENRPALLAGKKLIIFLTLLTNAQRIGVAVRLVVISAF